MMSGHHGYMASMGTPGGHGSYMDPHGQAPGGYMMSPNTPSHHPGNHPYSEVHYYANGSPYQDVGPLPQQQQQQMPDPQGQYQYHNPDKHSITASHSHNQAMEWLIILHRPLHLNINNNNNISPTIRCSQHKDIRLPQISEHPSACIHRQSLNLLLQVALQLQLRQQSNNTQNQ